MHEVNFICTGCGTRVRTYRMWNYRTWPPSMDERDLCQNCKDIMTKLEELCRALCIADGVDPDKEGYGLGQQMPEGQTYPLWRAREQQVRAMIECLKTPDAAMLDAARKVFQQSAWTQHMLFDAILDAILENQP